MLKQRLEDGGKVDLLNAAVTFLAFAYNLIDLLYRKQDILKEWVYTAPLLILSILSLILHSKMYRFFLYTFLALMITIFTENAADFSGAIFFIFAFAQVKRPWAIICVSLLTLITVSFRSISVGDTIAGNMLMLLVYFFSYTIYWLTIYKQPKKHFLCELTERENTFLDLLATGKGKKEIAFTMQISTDTVYHLTKEIRAKLDCKTFDQALIIWSAKNSREK